MIRAVARRLSEASGDQKVFKMSPCLDWFSAVSYHAMGVLTDMSSARLVIACFPAWAACVMKVWRDSTIIRPGAHGVGPDNLTFTLLENQP